MEKIEITKGYHGACNITITVQTISQKHEKDNFVKEYLVYDYWAEDLNEALNVVSKINDFLESAHKNGLYFHKEKEQRL